MGGKTRPGGIAFEHPVAFWLGTVAVSAGVAMHLPMFFEAKDMGYMLAGMGVDGLMAAGMILIVVGLLLAAWGLVSRRTRLQEAASGLRIRALDDAPLKKSHVALLLTMAAAITIDIAKPTTLGFVLPGFAAGVQPQVAAQSRRRGPRRPVPTVRDHRNRDRLLRLGLAR